MSNRLDRFPAVCTNDDARSYFREKGLSYDSINEGDILVLAIFCQHELKKSCKAGETSVSTMCMSKKIDMKLTSNGKITSCFLYMNFSLLHRAGSDFLQPGWVHWLRWLGRPRQCQSAPASVSAVV